MNWKEVHTFKILREDGYKIVCDNPDDFVSNRWFLFDPLGAHIASTSTRLARKDPETVVPQQPIKWAEKEIAKHEAEMKRLEAEMKRGEIVGDDEFPEDEAGTEEPGGDTEPSEDDA